MSTKESLRREAGTVEENADDIAERIQALGGVPISGPASLEEHAPVEFEGEDVYDARTSMGNDLEMYGDIIERVREHVSLAEDLGDYASGELLRDVLEDDTLVLEEALN